MRESVRFEDVSSQYGIPEKTLKRWTRAGGFPGIHLAHGHWIVMSADLDAWVEAHRSRKWSPSATTGPGSVRRHA